MPSLGISIATGRRRRRGRPVLGCRHRGRDLLPWLSGHVAVQFENMTKLPIRSKDAAVIGTDTTPDPPRSRSSAGSGAGAERQPKRWRRWTRDHPVVVFVAFAYGFSWAYWLPMVLAAHGVSAVPWSSHVPGLIGPMLAAVVVTSTIDGRAGLKALIRSCVRVPSMRWLVVAISPLLLLAVIVVATLPVTGGVPWSDFGRFDGLPSTIGPMGVLVVLVVVNGIGEEAGWRGFLQPTLQHDVSVKRATLTVTAIWAVWHTPLFLLDDGLGKMPLVMIPVWLIGLTAGAVVLAWLYNHTSSVLAVALWHGTYNWTAATDAAEQAIGALVTAMVIVAALVLVRRDPLLGTEHRSSCEPLAPTATDLEGRGLEGRGLEG